MKELSLNELVLINQYAQNACEKKDINDWYEGLTEAERQDALVRIWGLSIQARVYEDDVDVARKLAGLKETHTPVRMMCKAKEPFKNRGYYLRKLKGKELKQAFELVLECFAIAEKRRTARCNENAELCNHWWHRNLSDVKVVKEILRQ